MKNLMFTVRMRTITLIAVLGVAAITSGQLHAVLIDFEEIGVPPGGNSIAGDRTSGGFNFDFSTDHSHLMNDSFGLANGTTYLVGDDYSGVQTLTMTQIGRGNFSLKSIDFGESDNLANLHATSVTITGNLSGGGGVTKLVNLDLLFDGPSGLNDFQTEVFNWNNLVSIVMDASGPGNIASYAIDNIAIVPEPATMCLLGLGGLMLCRRKKA